MPSTAVDDGGALPPNPPKLLPILSFPNRIKSLKTPSEMATPPLHIPISVPFKWEEAPGKPRHCGKTNGGSSNAAARSLELPPRLLTGSKARRSPTTVLDGPYIGQSLSMRKGGSFRGESTEGKEKEKVLFGSSRWGGNCVVVASDNGFDFSSSHSTDAGGDSCCVAGLPVKITKVSRKASFFSLSQARSHVLAGIYSSLKQVVPWRRGQGKTTRTKTF